MSFYYAIDQYNLATTLSYAPTVVPQVVPVSNIYFLQSELSIFQNLNLHLPTSPTPPQLPQLHYLPYTQETERRLASEERLEHKKVKKTRRKNVEKELESAKKNSESNIINQLYSYFLNFQKSEVVVDRAIKLLGKDQSQIQKIRAIFYNCVRLMNYKRGRRYVNKQTIRNYYTPQNFLSQIPEIIQKLAEAGLLQLEELCFIFRVCTSYFVKNVSILAVLSSKRISMVAKKEHLKRRRLVQRSLQANLE